MQEWTSLHCKLGRRIAALGVLVREERLGPQTTGVFDGLSITVNSDCDLETRCHNLGHALGHIVQWSRQRSECEALYERLYAAKDQAATDPTALEQALDEFRRYEVEASEHAVSLLLEVGGDWALPSFTRFARADIEAIVQYHRVGEAPLWPEFFADWQRRADRGEFPVYPFEPRPIPHFVPQPITPQEVIRAVSV